MFKRVYIEITNICNLKCSFCPGTDREKRFMSLDEFCLAAGKLRKYTDYIYLHVMGEPLMHPQLAEIIDAAAEMGYKVNVTTNGTLLKKRKEILTGHRGIRKVSVSLHSYEGNTERGEDGLREYLEEVWSFCEEAECIVALRLWNEGGANSLNESIMSFLSEKTGLNVPNLPADANGRRLGGKIYLESAEKFIWPSTTAVEQEVTFCHGLSQQIAVLSDGTVVPCCLDGEGAVNLGNIFNQSVEEIIESPRAVALKQSFINHAPCEELCRRCDYARRF